MLDRLLVQVLPAFIVTLGQGCLRRMLVEELDFEEAIRDDLGEEVNGHVVSLQDPGVGEHLL